MPSYTVSFVCVITGLGVEISSSTSSMVRSIEYYSGAERLSLYSAQKIAGFFTFDWVLSDRSAVHVTPGFGCSVCHFVAAKSGDFAAD